MKLASSGFPSIEGNCEKIGFDNILLGFIYGLTGFPTSVNTSFKNRVSYLYFILHIKS